MSSGKSEEELNLERDIYQLESMLASLRRLRDEFDRRRKNCEILRTGICRNCFGKGEYENNHNGDWQYCWCPFGSEKRKKEIG